MAEIVQPLGWPRPNGYANGVVAEGRHLFVAGQVGWDPVTGEFATDDFVSQAGQALRNVATVLRAGGAEASHVVRMTWYITAPDLYTRNQRALGNAYREVFGTHFPAMSLVVVSALLEERALVEIEATAVIPERA